jgi:uncharacterized membrane protein YkvA (DUF1232 family)
MSKAKKRSWWPVFLRKRKRAAALATAPAAALATVDRALAKAGKLDRSGRLAAAIADVFTLGRLARAWARREYRAVSTGTVVLTLAALVYFVSPLDAVLDGLPGIGLLDDAAVLAWVIGEIRAELVAFRGWEQARQAPPALDPVPETLLIS